jgi:nitrous oxidase accessory protein
MKKLLLLSFILAAFISQARTLTVGQGKEYKTIGEAIQKADSADEVVVYPGIYHEHDLVITKPIRLAGIHFPVIDGDGKYAMMYVRSNGVIVEGFNFRNSGSANIQDIAAVKFEYVGHCIARNNHLDNNFFGIYFANCHNCLVENNIIKGNYGQESEAGNGIHCWKSDSMTVRNNSVTGHRDGMYFEFTKHSVASHNYSFGNVRYGLHFMFSDYNHYDHNCFRENGSGVAVMYTHDIVMTDNVFEHNWGGAAYGLLLKNISRSIITGNVFTENTIGINLEESSNLLLGGNDFHSNGWAMKIMASCTDDSVKDNNFVANTFDVSTNSSGNLNTFTHNYWDKYRGYDLNKNGEGDVPFRPVSFSSWVMEQLPYSVMLLRSMICEVLDQVERIAPAVIPETLLDDAPRMHEIKRQPIITFNSKELPV